MLRVVITLVVIWIAINLLFVVLVIPPRKSQSESDPLYPVESDRAVGRRGSKSDRPPTPWQTAVSLVSGACFSLVPLFVAAIETIRRLLGKSRR